MKNSGLITVRLTAAQLKQLARYETTFDKIAGTAELERVEFICPEVYSFTLEDLTAALHNLKKEDPTIHDFAEYWFYPINELEDAFDLDRARGYEDDEEDTETVYRFLPVSESDRFEAVWDTLQCWADQCEEETHLSEESFLDALLADLARYEANKGKPVEEWKFSGREMKNYIRCFEHKKTLKTATEQELALCRKFIEALIGMDSGLALQIKGYACYGGNRLYACNWPVSRDCITRLYEKTDDPVYANTLGYIYYYGRCTDGVPEYEKAFEYFEIAAANGICEGLYKLADMYRHGYACKKSPRTALSLYQMVYQHTLPEFLAGDDDSNFADAALRMGNVFAKGIGRERDPEQAYFYYTQAYYAAKLRAKCSDFFGNTTVINQLQKALEETRAQLREDYFQTYTAVYSVLFELAEDRHQCTLTRTPKENGNWLLTAARIKTRACRMPEAILITCPQIDLCVRTKKITVEATDVKGIWFAKNADSIRYDAVEWNDDEERCEFFLCDTLVGWIRFDELRLYARPAKKPYGREYRFASVRFGESGRTYDYICEMEDVKVGDKVIVNGYSGETEVEVVGLRVKRASELGLPAERYKKVIRKA